MLVVYDGADHVLSWLAFCLIVYPSSYPDYPTVRSFSRGAYNKNNLSSEEALLLHKPWLLYMFHGFCIPLVRIYAFPHVS